MREPTEREVNLREGSNLLASKAKKLSYQL